MLMTDGVMPTAAGPFSFNSFPTILLTSFFTTAYIPQASAMSEVTMDPEAYSTTYPRSLKNSANKRNWAKFAEEHSKTACKEAKKVAITDKLKFVIKRFADGETPICYKEGNIDGLAPTASCSVVNRKIMERREKALKNSDGYDSSSMVLEENDLFDSPTPYTGLLLVELSGKRWAIYDSVSQNTSQPVPAQTYAFVTMPDHSIRITLAIKSAHIQLSGISRYIRYAGEVKFDKQQKIASWNNQSGGYYPPSFLASQAGFGDGLSRFKGTHDRNDSSHPNNATFSYSPVNSR
jgi:hypothetical protein